MSAPARDPYLALRYPGYRRYITGHFLSNVGRQALIAAATWQIYQWTNSATALGLVGLVNVLPLLTFALRGGALADRFDRRVIIRRAMFASAALSAALVLTSHYHGYLPGGGVLEAANRGLLRLALLFERHADPASLRFDNPGLPLLYLILFLQAIIRVLAGPSRAAIVPQLLPAPAVGNAITWNTSLFELSTVIGPALAGPIVAYGGYAAAYSLDVFASLVLALVMLDLPLAAGATVVRPPAVSALAGARFIRDRQPILAAMTLDLFAVVMGGATALLPIYADRILHVGPIGFGWLRAAPAIGAALTAIASSHLPPFRRPGVVMLWAVAGFGLSLCVFSVSTSFVLSLAALFLSGVCDNISVVVRHTMVQLMTPDSLRGRVTAVNQMFIGCSNEVSTLRAGLSAALLGPVAAAGLGGLGIFGVTLFVAWKWPQLKSVPPLHTLQPDEEALPH
ncbi:MAG TPA: MFS transporter [Opitutaceae bacterium]|nr:MFS transporter [Opitutaceae bacterium]